MVVRHQVEGYDGFCKFMETFTGGELVYIYFSGTKLSNGQSWCPDCVRAQPVVEGALEKCTENSHFVFVQVGDVTAWMNSPFRKDPRTRLNQLPTLLRWKSHQKLEGEQCENPDLVEMLYTDDVE